MYIDMCVCVYGYIYMYIWIAILKARKTDPPTYQYVYV